MKNLGVSATFKSFYRKGVFEKNPEPQRMASPTNVVLGMFMFWWGWPGFNCGSTFGVSGGTVMIYLLTL